MSAADNYRVWVGCLACYNEGLLLGEWFDGAAAPEGIIAFDEALDITPANHKSADHEELWVMDHGGSPVPNEYSPMDAVRYAAELEHIDADELEPYVEWLGNQHTDFSADDIEAFRDSRIGEDLADFVADVYGSDKLPDWIKPHIGLVYDAIAHDMILGGEVYVLSGIWYKAS